MDSQPKPQFVESALEECCSADCSSCPTFPAPFRRIGDSSYCRFSQRSLAAGEGLSFPAGSVVRILFILSGSLRIEPDADNRTGTARLATSKQCVCLDRNGSFVATAQDADTRVVVLSLILRAEFCCQDLLDRSDDCDSQIPVETLPMLSVHPFVEQLVSSCFMLPQMTDCVRYHRMKASELFMMIRLLYTPTEQAYFFQAIMQPRDNFRAFVCTNYDRVQRVADLAALAGMSLSVFKRRFAEHFHDSVYHWMQQQKARKILADIRDGEDSTRALMDKYGFRHYTQFSRFCKNYLLATPARLIHSARKQ